MPLFMDRHDLPGVSAEQVAELHVLDVAIAERHGVRFLTYWFDAATGAAFCLADAPDPESMQTVHRQSHGQVANQIIPVSEDSVLRFLETIREPSAAAEVASAFRTVVFTDLEGSTGLAHAVGDSAYMRALTEHDVIIRRALVAEQGREVKHTGDGIMAAFAAVDHALACALAIQDGFERRRATGARPELRVRIGLAAGEPVDHNDDLFGSTVNLASRICGAARGGQILVAELVHELGVDCGFSFSDRHERTLRGFPGKTALFELLGGPQARLAALQ